MYNLKNQLHELTQKEMTRKEFLATVGFGIASIFGLSAILNMLGKEPNHMSQGYGSNTYGNNKEI